MRVRRTLLALAVAIAGGAVTAHGQQNVVQVRVIDASNTPVADAELGLRRIAGETEMRSVTARDGVAFFRAVAPGRYVLRTEALGFTTREDTISIGSGTLQLELLLAIAPVPLPGVEAEGRVRPREDGMSGFWLRRSQGIGTFLTREEIERLRPLKTADIFRRVPETRIELMNYAPVAVFGRTRDIQGRPCVPAMFVDGAPYVMSDRGLDDFNPDDIEALEMYSGSARIPAQFNATGRAQPRGRDDQIFGSPRCGAIIIWTRRGQRR
jgi:hypothetical protein